jgi:hypothetical protein
MALPLLRETSLSADDPPARTPILLSVIINHYLSNSLPPILSGKRIISPIL